MRRLAEKKEGFFFIDYIIHILMFEIKEEFIPHYYFFVMFSFPSSACVRNLVFLFVKKNTDSYFYNLFK